MPPESSQLSWDKTYLIAAWIETLVYGFFLCLFFATIYVHFQIRKSRDIHSLIMFGVGVVFFVLATIHLGMNCYRLVRGYVDFATVEGGAARYLSELAPWDHVFKDTIYATTEILGDAVSIYRCWVVWDRSWKVIVLPTILLIVSIISGYTVIGLYTTIQTDNTVFDGRLTSWVTTFYSVVVIQSGMSTGLMMYRIWQAEKRTSAYRTGRSPLRPILWILLESAALLVVVELVLLLLYSAQFNSQYLLLEPITPIVGITFTSITLRITLSKKREEQASVSMKTQSLNFGIVRGRPEDSVSAFTNSASARHIAISITRDVEATCDAHDGHRDVDGSSYDSKTFVDGDTKEQV
ncbi:hypothetical protein BXZ70DRAFT_914849 [Cristinia sonorae]|uniref:Uncharacterized protein n=1 Tax=Cristinia sonorae TaxID=1940300 RepID=A0A8K0UXT0_9AGAR|nr:hypothetical protein BXZ70DRAFT_914849 [Cristinia sonorae]